MPTNEFIGFATDPAANVVTQAQYAASSESTDGMQTGMAKSDLCNKVWRQGANMAAALGTVITDHGYDALDDGDVATLASSLSAALSAVGDYSASIDYVVGAIVNKGGVLYVSTAINGPGSTVVDPATDTAGTAWRRMMIGVNGVLAVSNGGTGQTSLDSVTVGAAKTLATARNINGTSFDGSSAITTAKWGTARNIMIQDSTAVHSGTAVSVDGSTAFNLPLPATIDADITGNAGTATAADAADQLTTARDVQVDLSLTTAASFDGTADITPGVTGTLAVGNGGTGETTLPPMLMSALAYSATEDYTPGTLVTQNDELFVCLTANGPLSTVISPSADTTSTYWSKVVSKTAMDTAITTAVSSAIAAEDAALMGKIFAQSTWYKRPELPTVTQTTVTIPSGTQVAIDSAMYISTSATTLSLDDFETAANRKGKDMYIYACVPALGTEPDFVLSLNSTVPSGYTATNSRKIGGFHCECADVDVIADHPLSGYLAGDILPLSVWDLLHRAVSENEGMVYVDGQWYDIYFSTLSGGKYSSIYNGNYVRGQSGEEMAEKAGAVQKRLIRRNEFLIVADGSNQMTVIGDASLRSNAGGHIDSDSRRMISNCGLEDCCGVQRQWTDDIFGAFNTTTDSYVRPGGIGNNPQTPASEGTPAERGNQDLRGYLWQADGRGTYNVQRDGENALNSKGHAFGAFARMSVGGAYGDLTNCGSRCVILSNLSSYNSAGAYSARLVSAARIVNL